MTRVPRPRPGFDCATASNCARGTARRNPDDPAQPQIGEEIAAARALSDVVHQLLDKAATQIEEATHKPAHLSV
jgi:hypothetical protein